LLAAMDNRRPTLDASMNGSRLDGSSGSPRHPHPANNLDRYHVQFAPRASDDAPPPPASTSPLPRGGSRRGGAKQKTPEQIGRHLLELPARDGGGAFGGAADGAPPGADIPSAGGGDHTDGVGDGGDGDGTSHPRRREAKQPSPQRAVVTLDAAQIAEARSVFDVFDADSSGAIDLAELRQAFASLGKKDISEKELYGILRSADVDNSGEIDFDEVSFVPTVLCPSCLSFK